jgi:hypothetical protein
LSSASFGQNDSTWQNTIYLEAGGPGGLGSVNIEHFLFTNNNQNLGARFGLGVSRFRDFENSLNPDFFIPFGIFANVKLIRHRPSALFLDAGVGLIYASVMHVSNDFKSVRQNKLNTYFQIGASYILSNHILFRVSYTPIISHGVGFNHWGAFSIGYTFK